MSHDLTNPLQSLIKTVAKSTPASTGEAARYRTRAASGGGTHVILCDVSSSMAESAGGGLRRIDHLQRALDQLRLPDHQIAAFATAAEWVTGALPAPSGGTALEMGLSLVALKNPSHTLVISDGEPTNPAAALDAARRLSGTISVLFCGDELNLAAVKFMRDLARLGCGRYAAHVWPATPVAPALTQAILALARA